MRDEMVIFRLLLVGVVLAIVFFWAHAASAQCTDGNVLLPQFTAPSGNGAGVIEQKNWRFLVEQVPEGLGSQLYGFHLTGPPVEDVWSPLSTPTSAWIYLQLMLIAQGGGNNGCLVEGLVEEWGLLVGIAAGFNFVYDLKPLRADHDGDGIINLLDPDALPTCTGVFAESDCVLPWDVRTGAVVGGGDEGIGAPAQTDVAGLPWVAGDFEANYGCDVLWGYGATDFYSDVESCYEFVPVGGNTHTLASLETTWRQEFFVDPSCFGTPDHAKPYVGAYNMVRAGPGGGQSAYFSAVWGKQVAFVNSLKNGPGWTDTWKYTSLVRWHRYVIINGLTYFQYWNPADNCWRPFSVKAGAIFEGTSSGPDPLGCGSGFYYPVVEAVLRGISWVTAKNYVPTGYYPGDVIGETASNVPNGEYMLPQGIGASGEAVPLNGYGAGAGNVPVTASDMEKAFAQAIQNTAGGSALADANAIASVLGDGADEALIDQLGGYTGTGVGGGGQAQGAVGDALGGLQGDLTGLLGTGSFGSSSQQGIAFDFVLPNPTGGADWVYSINTSPDVTTTAGLALNAVRLLCRLVFSFFAVWRFGLAVIGSLKGQ